MDAEGDQASTAGGRMRALDRRRGGNHLRSTLTESGCVLATARTYDPGGTVTTRVERRRRRDDCLSCATESSQRALRWHCQLGGGRNDVRSADVEVAQFPHGG